MLSEASCFARLTLLCLKALYNNTILRRTSVDVYMPLPTAMTRSNIWPHCDLDIDLSTFKSNQFMCTLNCIINQSSVIFRPLVVRHRAYRTYARMDAGTHGSTHWRTWWLPFWASFLGQIFTLVAGQNRRWTAAARTVEMQKCDSCILRTSSLRRTTLL